MSKRSAGSRAARRRSPTGERQTFPMHTKSTRKGSAAAWAGASRFGVGTALTIDSIGVDRRNPPISHPHLRPVSSCPEGAPPDVPEHPFRPAQRRDRRARRPRQDHAGRRDAAPGGRVHGAPGRGGRRARHGHRRARAREGHHDPRQEHRGALRRTGRRREADDDQHHRHPRPRRLRRRGRARAVDGRRDRAARRRLRGPAPADPVRAAQGAERRHAGDPGRQQDRPQRRPDRRGGRRDLRAVPGPARRVAQPGRPGLPGRLRVGQGGRGVAHPAGERHAAAGLHGPRAAVPHHPGDDPRADVHRRGCRCRRTSRTSTPAPSWAGWRWCACTRAT